MCSARLNNRVHTASIKKEGVLQKKICRYYLKSNRAEIKKIYTDNIKLEHVEKRLKQFLTCFYINLIYLVKIVHSASYLLDSKTIEHLAHELRFEKAVTIQRLFRKALKAPRNLLFSTEVITRKVTHFYTKMHYQRFIKKKVIVASSLFLLGSVRKMDLFKHFVYFPRKVRFCIFKFRVFQDRKQKLLSLLNLYWETSKSNITTTLLDLENFKMFSHGFRLSLDDYDHKYKRYCLNTLAFLILSEKALSKVKMMNFKSFNEFKFDKAFNQMSSYSDFVNVLSYFHKSIVYSKTPKMSKVEGKKLYLTNRKMIKGFSKLITQVKLFQKGTTKIRVVEATKKVFGEYSAINDEYVIYDSDEIQERIRIFLFGIVLIKYEEFCKIE